jgi:polycystin 1L2
MCTHTTAFAGGIIVAPNTIDWDFVFSNMEFSKNPTIYATMLGILLLYIIAMAWARRRDRKDLQLVRRLRSTTNLFFFYS